LAALAKEAPPFSSLESGLLIQLRMFGKDRRKDDFVAFPGNADCIAR
jgi:hypothetical protein